MGSHAASSFHGFTTSAAVLLGIFDFSLMITSTTDNRTIYNYNSILVSMYLAVEFVSLLLEQELYLNSPPWLATLYAGTNTVL